MLNTEGYFTSLRVLENPITINVAKSDTSITAIKIADVEVVSIVNGKEFKCSDKDLLYVPTLKCNLSSVRRVEE